MATTPAPVPCRVFLTQVKHGLKQLLALITVLSRTSKLLSSPRATYLQIMLPLDLLWQGLICSEQAIAFHISGWHFLISRTGIFINGILMLPFSHSFMSFMAPWSD